MNLANKIEAKAIGMNPFTRICYICGRQFGTKSIGIHEKNCIEKWQAAQAKLPKAQRQPVPKRPEGWDDSIAHPQATQNLNDAAFNSYMEQARKNCPNCGRGFAGDRLEVHLRSCTPNGYFAQQAKNRQEKKGSSGSLSDTSSSKDSIGKCIKNLEKKSHLNIKPAKETDTEKRLPELPKPVVLSGEKKMAKFCTYCGIGFPNQEAKFCGGCGKQRVPLA